MSASLSLASNFFILSQLQVFVKYFFEAFQLFQNHLPKLSVAIRRRSRSDLNILAHPNRFVKTFFRSFSTRPAASYSFPPPSRTACIYYHRPYYLSIGKTIFFEIIFRGRIRQIRRQAALLRTNRISRKKPRLFSRDCCIGVTDLSRTAIMAINSKRARLSSDPFLCWRYGSIPGRPSIATAA